MSLEKLIENKKNEYLEVLSQSPLKPVHGSSRNYKVNNEVITHKVKDFSYRYSIKLSGNVVTMCRSDKHINRYVDYDILEDKEKNSDETIYSKQELLERSLIRARKKLIDYVNCNVFGNTELPKFMTLTFRDDVEGIDDLKKVNLYVKNFIKRLNYFHSGEKKSFLKYIGVPELHLEGERAKQGRKVWHYHLIFFNLPYTHYTDLNKVWGLGATDISAFYGKKNNKKEIVIKSDGSWYVEGKQIKNVGHYIAKVLDYVSKNLDEDKVQELGHDKNQNFYIRSRNLKEPFILPCDGKNWTDFYNIIEKEFEVLKDNQYKIDSEFLGQMLYRTVIVNVTDIKRVRAYIDLFIDDEITYK